MKSMYKTAKKKKAAKQFLQNRNNPDRYWKGLTNCGGCLFTKGHNTTNKKTVQTGNYIT